MRKPAIWGANNPIHARILIALGHIFLVINALWLGFLLYFADIRVPKELTLMLTALFMAAYWFYPKKYSRHYTFGKRKAADFVLIAAYVFAITGYYNAGWFVEDREQRLAELNRVAYLQVANRAYEPSAEKIDWKEQVRQLRKELRSLKEEKPLSGGMKTLLIFLSVLGALGIAFLVAAIACNLTCSGAEGLAWVVLILGWAGAIFLAVLLIKSIIRRPTKRKNQSIEQT